MVPLERLPEIGPEVPLEKAVELLSRSPWNRGLVIADNRLAGLLSITDATRMIEAHGGRLRRR
jgi:CBS domain-containing protein